MPTITPPLTFTLRYRREAYSYSRFRKDAFIRTPDKDKELPDIPAGFTPLEGDFPTVSARADELNDLQLKSGFLFYFYFPEVVPADAQPDHCDMCRRARHLKEL